MHMAAFMHGVFQKFMFMGDDQTGNVQVLNDLDEAASGSLIQPGSGLIQ
jgi:hypothetical protein